MPTSSIVGHHFEPTTATTVESLLRAGDIYGAHHLARYLWAVDVLSGLPNARSILDIACGSAYGSRLIASTFPAASVTGVDTDATAIASANEVVHPDNLTLRVADGMRWIDTIGTSEFDVIVSFDTLEHVKHRELFLQGCVDHLAPQGSLLLSTPCSSWEPSLSPGWDAHAIEYSAPALFDFLSRYFRTLLRPENGTLPSSNLFQRYNEIGLNYVLWMNPVIARDPIVIPKPFRPPG